MSDHSGVNPYPHTYVAGASGAANGPVAVTAPELPDFGSAAPPQFDGPGGMWSPETLLCAALADCFILTFRALGRATRLDWRRLDCRVEGTLERVERVAQFTAFTTFAELVVPSGTDAARAHKLLEQAEHACLIANSLRGTRALEMQVLVED